MRNNFCLILSLILILYSYLCQGHADESPYCQADLENINTRTHFVNDNIEDPTGGFKLSVQPKLKNEISFSPDFIITLDSTKYKTIKGLLLYVEHENQTNFVNEEDNNLRIGHFIDIKDQYFKPKSCGIKSPVNSTLEHFNREDKPLPQTFSWTLKNVFDYENNFHAVIKAIAVVSMKEWGVPEPLKFQPKNIMQKLYPNEYEKYVIFHTPFLPRMKIHAQSFYAENPYLFIIIVIISIFIIYSVIRFIIRRIKLYRKDVQFEEYHRLDSINIPKIK